MKKFIFVMLLLLLAVPPLQAKKVKDLVTLDTEELFDLSLEELLDTEISSAGKMMEKVSEIPASVYIVTREDIETYGWRTLAEVIRHIPGFYTVYDYQEDVIGVRGVMDDNILFLVNGVVQHTSSMNEIMMPSEAIDRIEVVRGPMSVIYGSGAFLGSVNIITNHIPYGEPLSMVSGSLGSLGVYKAYARASGEKGAFHYTLNASAYGSNGLDAAFEDMVSSESYEGFPPGFSTWTGGHLERENVNVNLSAGYGGFYGDIQFNGAANGMLDDAIPFMSESVEEIETITAQVGYRRELWKNVHIDGRIALRSEYDYEKIMDYVDLSTGNEEFYELSKDEARLDAELDVIWKPSDVFSMITGFSYESVPDFTDDLSFSKPRPIYDEEGNIKMTLEGGAVLCFGPGLLRPFHTNQL